LRVLPRRVAWLRASGSQGVTQCSRVATQFSLCPTGSLGPKTAELNLSACEEWSKQLSNHPKPLGRCQHSLRSLIQDYTTRRIVWYLRWFRDLRHLCPEFTQGRRETYLLNRNRHKQNSQASSLRAIYKVVHVCMNEWLTEIEERSGETCPGRLRVPHERQGHRIRLDSKSFPACAPTK
jgi:hypothetical protein